MTEDAKMMLKFVPERSQILREPCRNLTTEEICSNRIQELIDDMFYTVENRKTGVGLSANQVGQQEAISVIAIKPTPARPNLKPVKKVCINTKIVETFGEKELAWEGCLSTAIDENGEASMGQVPRYQKIRVEYYNREGRKQSEIAEGFVAQVIQHETDHLNGILFTDYIGTDGLISYQEFIKRLL